LNQRQCISSKPGVEQNVTQQPEEEIGVSEDRTRQGVRVYRGEEKDKSREPQEGEAE
jgi:hypothetical protein